MRLFISAGFSIMMVACAADTGIPTGPPAPDVTCDPNPGTPGGGTCGPGSDVVSRGIITIDQLSYVCAHHGHVYYARCPAWLVARDEPYSTTPSCETGVPTCIDMPDVYTLTGPAACLDLCERAPFGTP